MMDDADLRELERMQCIAEEWGGFLVMHLEPEDGMFEALPARFVFQEDRVRLDIGPDTYLIRPADFIRAIERRNTEP